MANDTDKTPIQLESPKVLDSRGRIIAPSIERPGNMTPVDVKLPSIAELRHLTDSELLEVAQRYGVYNGWNDLFTRNAALVEQLGRIPPGSVAFWNEVERITEPMRSTGTAKSIARTSMRSYNQIIASDGDPDTVMVRVGEGDDLMCDGCMAIESAEGTYSEHEAIGLPGTQECGGHCRCMLIPVDTPDPRFESAPLLTGDDAERVIEAILNEADNDLS